MLIPCAGQPKGPGPRGSLGSGKSQKNANDALSTAIAALRNRRLHTVVADDHAVILRMLADRHHDLTRFRTQAVCRLHAMLANLVRGGISGALRTSRAAVMLASVRPVDGVVAERKRQALGASGRRPAPPGRHQ